MNVGNGLVSNVPNDPQLRSRTPWRQGVQRALDNLHLILSGTYSHRHIIVVDEDLPTGQKPNTGIGDPLHSLMPAAKRATEHMCAVPGEGSIELWSKVQRTLLIEFEDRNLGLRVKRSNTHQVNPCSNRDGARAQVWDMNPYLRWNI